MTQIRSIRSFNHFGELALNAQKFTKSRDLAHAHFSETFVRGSTCRDYPWKHACQIWSSYL